MPYGRRGQASAIPRFAWPRGHRPRLPEALAALALCIGAAGCGESQSGKGRRLQAGQAGSSAGRAVLAGLRGDEDDDDLVIGNAVGAKADNDADGDNDRTEGRGTGYYDGDDRSVSRFGLAAGAGDAARLKALVVRYAAAESVADGGRACAMLEPSVAAGLGAAYGSVTGPAYLRGATTCPEVMTRLFKHLHRRLSRRMTVVEVRVGDGMALVLLGSKDAPASYYTLRREPGGWRLTEMLAGGLP